MDHPEIILVLARATNGVIGVDGKLPWHIPADLRHFKQLTKGRPMIMGRKTFDSLPGLLDGRRHIVLTRDPDWAEEGAEIARSPEEALKLANGPHVCVIGGAEIYALFLPLADRIELTEIDARPDGDTSLPAFDSDVWQEIAREELAGENGRPAFAFVTLQRKAV
jgi:dihydrofolate reductase